MNRTGSVTMHVFEMEVRNNEQNIVGIRITNEVDETAIDYHPADGSICFKINSSINELLFDHLSQLRKILNIRDETTLVTGFKLKFAIRENKDVEGFNDKSKIMVIDKRGERDENYLMDRGADNIHEIYTDGSYAEHHKKGGYTVIIRNPNGEYELHTLETKARSSCLIELKAAIKGLELLKDVEKVRLVTDSQYVRKGLTEWILNWKLNGWQTARGKKAKNITYWKHFDKLTNNRYIEFQWVKGHSNHFENTMCDLYAKDMANGKALNEPHKPRQQH
ncbi:MAG: ribonuclease HI [Bacteroidales bacterium]|nr:ribonuclease HI [Bacteroidales bacterium]